VYNNKRSIDKECLEIGTIRGRLLSVKCGSLLGAEPRVRSPGRSHHGREDTNMKLITLMTVTMSLVFAMPAGAQSPPTANGRLSSEQRGAIGDHIRECWTKDANAAGPTNRSMTLKVTVDANNIARTAEVFGEDIGRLGDAGVRAFAERARRAVLDPRCANLPLPAALLGKVNILTIRFSDDSPRAADPAAVGAPVPSVADMVQTEMDAGARDTGIALAAQFCTLRSKQWVATIQAGLQAILDRDSRRMSPGDFGRVLDRARPKQDAEVYRYFPNHCAALRASGEIERLDRFETIVTGNYH
jgi:hypothetical protein